MVSSESSFHGFSRTNFFDEDYIILKADELALFNPVTVTNFTSERSKGGIHDYFSEGPYWWPDPENPDGPYIRRDGERNPENFKSHRSALGKLKEVIVFLTAAWAITEDQKYVIKIEEHLSAWFIDSETKMNPNMQYAQAIQGISDGRGIGIIDAVSLVHVANAVRVLQKKEALDPIVIQGTKAWFEEFSDWITTHPYGLDERDHGNNHSTWWGAQLSTYSLLTGNERHQEMVREQYILQIEKQVDREGRLTDELTRTRPWHYMIYNLNAWTNYAVLLNEIDPVFFEKTLKHSRHDIRVMLNWSLDQYNNPGSWSYPSELEPIREIEAEDFMFLGGHVLNDKSMISKWISLLPEQGSRHAELFLYKELYDF